MADRTPDLLFDYVRDMIYDPSRATLSLDDLDPKYRDVGEALTVLEGMLTEQRRYAEALARGEMNTPIPSRENELASSLKSLHASLRHITWQTQRVAEGDYQQRVDFMGDFSESFNSMIRELDAHKKLLELQIAEGERKNRSLQNNVSLFVALTAQIPQAILVIGHESQEPLFHNEAAKKMLAGDPALMTKMTELLTMDLMTAQASSVEGSRHTEIMTAPSPDEARYYSMHRYHIQWGGSDAVAFVTEDITDERLNTLKLERLANVDELTKLYVRRYGMEVFERWVAGRRKFSLCFVDLDFLKYTNDTFGHDIGDIYITTAARLISELAPGAVAARLGGDEFMILVPFLGEAQILPLMDELEEALARAPQDIDIDDETRAKLKFHASFGIVEVPTDGSAVPSDLLSAADKKMYEYKMAHKAARRA